MKNDPDSPEELFFERIKVQILTGEKIFVKELRPHNLTREEEFEVSIEQLVNKWEREKQIKSLLSSDGIYSLWMSAKEDILLYIGEADRMIQRIKTHMRVPEDHVLSLIPRYLDDFGVELRFDLKIENLLHTRDGKKEFLRNYCFWRIFPLKERKPILTVNSISDESGEWQIDKEDYQKKKEVRDKVFRRRRAFEGRLITTLRPVFRKGGIFLNPQTKRIIKETFKDQPGI